MLTTRAVMRLGLVPVSVLLAAAGASADSVAAAFVEALLEVVGGAAEGRALGLAGGGGGGGLEVAVAAAG